MLQAKSLQPEMVSFATKASKKLQKLFLYWYFFQNSLSIYLLMSLKNFLTSSKFVKKIYRSDSYSLEFHPQNFLWGLKRHWNNGHEF